MRKFSWKYCRVVDSGVELVVILFQLLQTYSILDKYFLQLEEYILKQFEIQRIKVFFKSNQFSMYKISYAL